MHDLIFALAFVAMVAAPAMVATWGGRKEYNPGPAPRPSGRSSTPQPRPTGQMMRPLSAQGVSRSSRSSATSEGSTLPMHNSRGMANR